jgi:hypothetical protein
MSSIYLNGPFPNTYGDNADAASDTFVYEIGNGWTPDVVVDYHSLIPATNIYTSDTLRYVWKGLGNLRYFARPGAAEAAEVVLRAAPGWLVQLNSLELAAWNNVTTTVLVGGVANEITLPSNDHYTYQPQERILASSITIRFGDAQNLVGIDNINFDQVQASATGAEAELPEPGTMLATGVGLALISGFSRRCCKLRV